MGKFVDGFHALPDQTRHLMTRTRRPATHANATVTGTAEAATAVTDATAMIALRRALKKTAVEAMMSGNGIPAVDGFTKSKNAVQTPAMALGAARTQTQKCRQGQRGAAAGEAATAILSKEQSTALTGAVEENACRLQASLCPQTLCRKETQSH